MYRNAFRGVVLTAALCMPLYAACAEDQAASLRTFGFEEDPIFQKVAEATQRLVLAKSDVDPANGARIFEDLASNHDMSLAQYQIGAVYQDGRGVPQDLGKAQYQQALAAGYHGSQSALYRVEAKLRAEHLSAAR